MHKLVVYNRFAGYLFIICIPYPIDKSDIKYLTWSTYLHDVY